MTLPEPFEELAQDPGALGAWLVRQRWFGSKDRTLSAVQVASAVPLSSAAGTWLLCVLRADYERGAPENYFLPLSASPAADTDNGAIRLATGGCFQDAATEPAFIHALLAAFRDDAVLPVQGGGEIRFSRASGWPEGAAAEPDVVAAGVEQSNSSIRVDGYGVLKLYRRLQPGAVSPEIDVAGYLTRAGFANTAPLLGAFELLSADVSATATSLGVMFGWIPNRGDAWRWAQDDLRQRAAAPAEAALADVAFFEASGRLGRRTAELHRALCPTTPAEAEFAPVPIAADDIRAWRTRVREAALEVINRIADTPSAATTRLAAAGDALLARLDALLPTGRVAAMKTRVHGDYHLGQVLFDGNDFHIIDFEGEPRRTIDARRAKESPLKDVAGVLRSFDYAAATIARELGDAAEAPADWTRAWAARACEAFLDGYRQTIAGCGSYPADAAQADELLELMLYDKALYEIGYELANRPDWVDIPVQGVLDLFDGGRAAARTPASSPVKTP